ncbi:MAG: helix-turn-helix domain-containing protein [Lachnospiraceae bacterium]|nr:helix-turn-helix domain-containing protein [Lachnospiraceae bacterium]
MNQNMLIQYLRNNNTEEQFFSELSKKYTTPEELTSCLRSMDPDRLHQLSMTTYHMLTDDPPVMAMNYDLEENSPLRTVRIFKHWRFVPAIEHSHDHFEIDYVLEGTCEHRINQQVHEMKAGDLCFLSPASRHSITTNPDTVLLCILISRSTIENLFSNALGGSDVISEFLQNSFFLKDYASHLIFHTEGDDEIRDQILNMFMEEFQVDEYADRIVSHMAVVFLIKIIRKYKKMAEGPAPHRSANGDTSRILRYIQENYATASLGEVAQMLNYSIPYCSKYIKLYTGQSFTELQKRIRFQKATDFLLNTSMSVERISERIGYANPENFMRMFKKEYGVSPTQFRTGSRNKV